MLLITERYLQACDMNVVSAATFGWDVTAALGQRVHAYGPLLEENAFDVIWTVGGETSSGYQSVEELFRWTAPPDDYLEFEQSPPEHRERIVRRATGKERIVCTHIPSPIAYPLNSGAVTVVNSMGLSDLLRSGHTLLSGQKVKPLSGWEWEHLISMFRGGSLLSVRDKESSDILGALGVEHRLAPDIAHALRILRPFR
jgi:hypothetical protein